METVSLRSQIPKNRVQIFNGLLHSDGSIRNIIGVPPALILQGQPSCISCFFNFAKLLVLRHRTLFKHKQHRFLNARSLVEWTLTG